MPWKRNLYPANWNEIRERILIRAGQCHSTPAKCEKCSVRNHAVGYRDASGAFHRNAGNGPCDASGYGEDFPSGLLSYADAKEFAETYNDHTEGRKRCDWEGNHWFVIVLTIAHLDHNKQNNADSNLAALCQRCHLLHDKDHHAANAKETRRKRTGQGTLTYA